MFEDMEHVDVDHSANLHLEGVEHDALSSHLSWSGTLALLEHLFGR